MGHQEAVAEKPQPQSEVFEPAFEPPPQSEPLPVVEKVTRSTRATRATRSSQESQEQAPDAPHEMTPNNGNHQVEEGHGNSIPEPQEFSNSELPSGPHETQSQDQNETPAAVATEP